MNRLRIVQVLPQLNSGGVERGTLEINRALMQRGHHSVVISGGGRLVDQLESEGGEHVQMQIWKKDPRTFLTVHQMRNWLIANRPHVIHVRSRIPAWVTWMALHTLGTSKRPKLVSTVHGLNRPSAYSRIMTKGEVVVAVSNTVRDYILTCYPDLDASKIEVIHRGVDPDEFPYGYQPPIEWIDRWYQEFPQLKNQFVVCMAGRVTRLKGHLDALAAIAKLRDQGKPIHLLIAGGEDPRRAGYSDELRQRIDELDLGKQVTFSGYRNDVRDILAIVNVSLSATAKPPESFGRSVLESVRLGKITLGYDHGGVGEVLTTVYPEGCIPLSDVDALAQRIGDAYEGKLAPPKPSSHFLLSTMQDQTIELYERLSAKDS